MAAKVVKLAAIPAALGLGLVSFRVHALSKGNKEELLSPQELSIYASPTQNLRYVEEQPGFLQRTFGRLRVGLQPYARTVEGAGSSVKAGAANVYRAGQGIFLDAYRFLKDPSPSFLPRLSVITVSGLAGLVLARKGSRLKRLGVPLGMAAVSTAVCYPAQTVGVLKLMGKKTYPASQWTSSAITSLWKTPSAAKEAIIQSTIPKDVPVPGSEVREPTIKPLPKVEPAEEALLSSYEPTSIPAPVEEVTSVAGSEVETSSISAEAMSQPLTVEPYIPVGPESVPTHIPEPELSRMKAFASPPIPEPEAPTMKESIPPPILEPQLPSGHESLPPSFPEPEVSSMKESVSPPILELELPTIKESIPLVIPELELPSGLESVLPTMPEPVKASVPPPVLEPEPSTGGESSLAPIPEPEPASLPSPVSPSVKEPLPLFEPKFEPIDELQVPLEPEPESKVTVTAESGLVQESAFVQTSEPELAVEAALVHIDELLPILAAPDPVALPNPPFLATPEPAPEVDTFAEESALPADIHSAPAFVDKESPDFPPPHVEENGPGPFEENKPFIVEAIVPQSSEETVAVEETVSPLPSLTGRSTHLSNPPVEITIPERPVQEASPLHTNGKLAPVEEVILLSPAADPSPLEPSVTTEKHGFLAESELADHGQAEPEDADLYSTRS